MPSKISVSSVPAVILTALGSISLQRVLWPQRVAQCTDKAGFGKGWGCAKGQEILEIPITIFQPSEFSAGGGGATGLVRHH